MKGPLRMKGVQRVLRMKSPPILAKEKQVPTSHLSAVHLSAQVTKGWISHVRIASAPEVKLRRSELLSHLMPLA